MAGVRVQQGERLRRRRPPAGEPPRSALYPTIRAAVRATLAHHATDGAEISVTLLDDDEIAELNRRYLERTGPTDVIAFALYAPGEEPVGDIYIGYPQARRQAAQLDVPPEEELARLAVHGTLHVLGYDHPEDEARIRSEMWQVQEEIMRALAAGRARD